MIGLDTNILVRYFAKDDPHQSAIAVRIVQSRTPSDPGWVSLPVLVELVWVLGRSYRQRRSAISHALDILVSSREIVIEREDIVMNALSLFRDGRADFADCLIWHLAQAAGCNRIVTFDRASARDTGMELLT